MNSDQDSAFEDASREELIHLVKQLKVQNAEGRPEKILQKAFEKISLLVVTIDQDGIIMYANEAFLSSIGWDQPRIVGQNWKEFLEPGKDLNKEEHIYTLLKKQGFIDQLKRKFLSKEGDTRTIKFSVVIHHPLSSDKHLTTLIGEDITDRKKVIRALKDSNEQLQDLFENANDLIQVFDLDGHIQFVNRAWKETLQYSDEEILSLNFRDILSKEHLDATIEHLNNILAGKKDDKFETVFTSKYGRNIQVIGSVNVRYEKDKPVLFRGIFHDNTEHMRAERAQNLYYKISSLAINSDKLDTLLANIHNELRTIIAVNNFHVALYDKDHNYLNFPYYVDENIGTKPISMKRIVGKGLTEYSLFNEEPTFLYEEDIEELAEKGIVELLGPIPKIWLGVPLKLENRTIGVICVKSHSDRNKYKKRHLELLDFISGQIALVIERKRNEEKIIDQTARLNAIFESSSHLIWSVNRRRGLTSFNQNYANAIFRKYQKHPSIDDGSGTIREILVLSDPSYHDFIDRKYTQAFNGHPQHFEASNTNQNGEIFWRETYLNPIFLPDGRIDEVSGISHDITEKKQWEMTIQESEEKFRNIFESFQDIYYRTDLHGKITMISPSGCELSGFSQDEIIGKHISDFFTTNKQQGNLIREVLKTGRVKNYETNVIMKDGVAIQCISNIRLIFNKEGKPVAVDGVARDITFLKKASEDLLHAKEIAEKSLKVKENFLANMSHEIRTPMNGVIGMIDLLNETPLMEEQRKYVQTIKKSSETLLNILNDILDLSKIEAGKMQLRLAPISIEQTIEKLHSLFYQQAALKNLELLYSIDSNVPKIILADETRLLQILSNLTSNAIKFTDKGSVKIQISLQERKDILNKIKVTISDTGIGIAPDKLNMLFGYFSQVDTSSSKTYGGTGLGLAISKELCKLMNGEIGVHTEANVGSAFWFTFEANESKRIVESKKEPEDSFMGKEILKDFPRILLVDDNAINLFVASEILRKAGCEVDTAGTGLEAIQKVKENSYKIILMDIQMPQMDGVEATSEIRKLNLSHTPPIIAMTAYSMKEDKERFILSGLDDYIAKPIKADVLIDKVKEWLREDLKLSEQVQQLLNKTINPPADNEVILDKDVFDKLVQLSGVDNIQLIYKEFEYEALEQLDNCKKSMKIDDFLNILNNLHTLKGVSGTLGLKELETISKSIETKLKQGNYPELSNDFNTLENAFNRFKEYYPFFITTIV
jgi:PAS domain S-box-containing protein